MDRTGDAAGVIDSLRAEFGDAVRSPDALRSSDDGRTGAVNGVTPLALLTPSSSLQAAAMLAFCNASSLHVVCVGGRTWLNSGDAIATPYVMVSSEQLSAIDQYEPADLTITVGAGARLSHVQRAVNANGQWLAQDAPALPPATVGGWVATASSGPLRARYGTPRDQVLGLEIVTGDGRLIRLGGRVVKNVAGYDVVRPVVGSHGALGMITSVSLRLRPMHARDATLAFAVSRDDAQATVDLLSKTFPLAAVELLSPWLATALLGAPAAHPDWTLLVRIHGNDAEVQHGRDVLRGALPEMEIDLPEESAVGSTLWDELGALEAAAPAALRLAAAPTRLQTTLDTANSLADLTFTGTPMIAAHAADGVVRAWGTRRDASLSPAFDEARRQIGATDGSLMCVQGFGRRGSLTGRKAAINEAIRRVFDPAGTLAGERL